MLLVEMAGQHGFEQRFPLLNLPDGAAQVVDDGVLDEIAPRAGPGRFTDVVMPHMSGKELADRVRALDPHTKILFTSAYTESAIVHQGVLEKGVALLQKPFTPSALAKKVRAVLDQSNISKPADAPEKFNS
jgi:CheY-like chemotaxis protein